MAVVFKETKGLVDVKTHYCPGCTHGIIHRLVGEVLEELGVLGNTVGVVPVGCSVLAYKYFNCDTHQASHGRAPAVATGVKRVHPDKKIVVVLDGSLKGYIEGKRLLESIKIPVYQSVERALHVISKAMKRKIRNYIAFHK